MICPCAVTLPLVAVLFWATSAQPQLRLGSLAEAQVGNLPGDSPRDLRSLYYQLNLNCAAKGFEAILRTEAFGSSAQGRSYAALTQRALHFRRERLEVAAGHFYAILGNGLLLHAFELPGVIAEDRTWRRRYQLARDLDGLQLRYRWSRAGLLLLRGVPSSSALPPKVAGRRHRALGAGEFTLRPWDFLETGIGVLEAGEETGAFTHARLRLRDLGEFYAEYAQRDARPSRWLSLDQDLGRGLYLSASLTAGPWGLSLEYKDYRDLLIADINNPPPLIREHESYLLNRLTHVLLPDDETGAQLEMSRAFAGGRSLVANYTRAFRRQDDAPLTEVFLQAESPLGERLRAQVFADLNRSRILKDERYLTFGSAWEWQASAAHALTGDLQFQEVDRRFGGLEFPFQNLYLSLGVAHSATWSAAVVAQRSTDALETGAPAEGASYWVGGNLSYQAREGHRLDLFGGKRRAGLACTAGTCYEVLGFEGVELRLVNPLF